MDLSKGFAEPYRMSKLLPKHLVKVSCWFSGLYLEDQAKMNADLNNLKKHSLFIGQMDLTDINSLIKMDTLYLPDVWKHMMHSGSCSSNITMELTAPFAENMLYSMPPLQWVSTASAEMTFHNSEELAKGIEDRKFKGTIFICVNLYPV